MGDRGKVWDREKRIRARSQREQILAWLASPRFPGDARLRHDGGDPPSRQFAAAKKNETPNHGKNQRIATTPLIRWSIQEVRRIAIRLARKRIRPAHIIAWSLWRRAHQAAAQPAHFQPDRHLWGGGPGCQWASPLGWGSVPNPPMEPRTNPLTEPPRTRTQKV